MRINSKYTRWVTAVIFVLFLGIGALLIYLGVKAGKLPEGWVEIQGTISNIEYDSLYDEYTAFCEYVVGGVTYNQALNVYDTTMHVGDLVTIAYNPASPAEMKCLDGNLVLIIIGAILCVIAFIVLIVKIIRGIKLKKVGEQKDIYGQTFQPVSLELGSPRTYTYRPFIEQRTFAMLDEKDESVYEAKCLKLNLVGRSTYEFVNKVTNEVTHHKVGVATSTSVGGSMFYATSSFTFDGMDVWAYVTKKYNVNINPTGLKTYCVTCKDQRIADIEVTGNEVVGSGTIVGGMVRQFGIHGFYKITTDEANIELAFMVAFLLANC